MFSQRLKTLGVAMKVTCVVLCALLLAACGKPALNSSDVDRITDIASDAASEVEAKIEEVDDRVDILEAELEEATSANEELESKIQELESRLDGANIY